MQNARERRGSVKLGAQHKVSMELADMAKRENEFADARCGRAHRALRGRGGVRALLR